jgi:hypothetical protein
MPKYFIPLASASSCKSCFMVILLLLSAFLKRATILLLERLLFLPRILADPTHRSGGYRSQTN